ncbi:hypothetical protein EDD86DRAFT_214424 [Gorgonomyces haynaldii]|nr:hypothetical protein EDD86DRAFT_214424 [Gorgonomyces haynaldii]
MLQNLPFFEGSPSEDFLVAIGRRLHMRKFDIGDVVVKHGDQAKAMFFILKGSLLVTSDDREVEFATLNAGSYFGEIAILYNVKRTATVITRTPCTLGILSSEDMHQTLKNFPDIEKIMRRFAHDRVKEMQEEFSRMGKTLEADVKVVLASETESAKDLEFQTSLFIPPTTRRKSQAFVADDFKKSQNSLTPMLEVELVVSPEEEKEPETLKPNLGARFNEKRKLSVAVWSDDKLMKFAQNLVSQTQQKESRLGVVVRRSNDSLGSKMLSPSTQSMLMSHQEKKQGLFNLPSFLIARIFQFLDFRSLFKLRRVNIAIFEIIQASEFELLRDIDLSPWNKKITNDVLGHVLQFAGSEVYNLNLKTCWQINNIGMAHIVQHSPAVVDLNLHSLWDITDEGLHLLVDNCIYLESINLSNCRKVSSVGLLRLMNSAPRMLQVTLSYCKSLSDEIMISPTWINVKSINFQRCTGITDAGFANWQQLSESPLGMRGGLPSGPMVFALEELNLSDCSFLTDATMAQLGKLCPQLKVLGLSFCCSLTEQFIDPLIEGCPFIELLDTSYCGTAITDDVLEKIGVGLPKLETLSVRGCVQVTDQGIKNLSASKTLTCINFTQCRFVTPDVLSTLGLPWTSITRPVLDQDVRGRPARAHTHS